MSKINVTKSKGWREVRFFLVVVTVVIGVVFAVIVVNVVAVVAAVVTAVTVAIADWSKCRNGNDLKWTESYQVEWANVTFITSEWCNNLSKIKELTT